MMTYYAVRPGRAALTAEDRAILRGGGRVQFERRGDHWVKTVVPRSDRALRLKSIELRRVEQQLRAEGQKP